MKDRVVDCNRSNIGKSDDEMEGSDIIEKTDKMLLSLKKKIFNSIQKSHKCLISNSNCKQDLNKRSFTNLKSRNPAGGSGGTMVSGGGSGGGIGTNITVNPANIPNNNKTTRSTQNVGANYHFSGIQSYKSKYFPTPQKNG